MDNPPESAELLSYQQVDKGHGRVETRTATICHDVDRLLERHDWPGLSAIGEVVAERRLAAGMTRHHRNPSPSRNLSRNPSPTRRPTPMSVRRSMMPAKDTDICSISVELPWE